MGKAPLTSAPIVPSTAEWYLHVKGHQSGPFSAEQVVGLLQDREIPPEQLVTSQRLHGRSIPVSQLATLLAAGSTQFDPPPRPDMVVNENLNEPMLSSPVADPTRDLFDTLQAVKERRSAGHSTESFVPYLRPTRGVTQQAGLLAALVAIAGGAIWGSVQLLSSPATSMAGSSIAEVAAKQGGATTPSRLTPTRTAEAVRTTTATRTTASVAQPRPATAHTPVRRFSMPDRPVALAPPPRPVAAPQAREDWRRGEDPRREETARHDAREEEERIQDARDDEDHGAESRDGEPMAVDHDPFAARSGDPADPSRDDENSDGAPTRHLASPSLDDSSREY